jgi:hypothetical protein
MPLERRLAAAGLALVLVVVLAAASLRLAGSDALVRAAHRVAASLEVIVAAWLAWLAWRARRVDPALGLVLALTVALSLLGIAGGRNPSELQAMGNLLGGLALAAAFAWLFGRTLPDERRVGPALVLTFGVLMVLQALIGARLSIYARYELPALPAHALLGIALTAFVGWLGLARIGGLRGKLVFALTLVTLVAGFSALQYERSATAALVHAGIVALLVVVAAATVSRGA